MTAESAYLTLFRLNFKKIGLITFLRGNKCLMGVKKTPQKNQWFTSDCWFLSPAVLNRLTNVRHSFPSWIVINYDMMLRTENELRINCDQIGVLPPHFPEDCIVSLFFVAGVDISSSASWRNPSLNALPWGFPQELAGEAHREEVSTAAEKPRLTEVII